MTTPNSGFKIFVDKTNLTAKNILNSAQNSNEHSPAQPEQNQPQATPNNDQKDKDQVTPVNPQAPQPK